MFISDQQLFIYYTIYNIPNPRIGLSTGNYMINVYDNNNNILYN